VQYSKQRNKPARRVWQRSQAYSVTRWRNEEAENRHGIAAEDRRTSLRTMRGMNKSEPQARTPYHPGPRTGEVIAGSGLQRASPQRRPQSASEKARVLNGQQLLPYSPSTTMKNQVVVSERAQQRE